MFNPWLPDNISVALPLSQVKTVGAATVASDPGHAGILNWTAAATIIGSDITYLGDSTNGATWTIAANGLYFAVVSLAFSAGRTFGITKNCTQLSVGITSVSDGSVLGIATTPAANNSSLVAVPVICVVGDILRLNCSSAPNQGTGTDIMWVTQISKFLTPQV